MIKFILLILFLWAYAILTGLSPSVLRSAMMFSFLLIGRQLGRSADTFNILVASGIALFLIFSPFLLFQTGFQLSYLAVAGILFFVPIIQPAFDPANKLSKYAWDMTAVSVGAQLATFPISLYYFHQFPNYFLFSNMIVIPLSTIIIFAGIALFFFTTWPAILFGCGYVLGVMVHAMNECVTIIENLPGAVWTSITANFFEVIILYCVILLASVFCIKRESKWLVYSLIAFNLFTGSRIAREYRIQHQSGYIVFQNQGKECIQLFSGTSSLMLVDSGWNSMALMALANWNTERGITRYDYLRIDTLQENAYRNKSVRNLSIFKNHILYQGESFLLVNKAYKFTNSRERKPIDTIIISANPNLSIKKLFRDFSFSLVIIESTNSPYREARWIKECNELGINYYLIRDRGAFLKIIS